MKMKLKNKVMMVAVLLAIIPTLLVTGMTTWIATSAGQEALENAALEKITAITSVKKREVESYFKTLSNQVLTFSNDRMVIQAMFQFKSAFTKFRADNEIVDVDQFKQTLYQYYKEHYLSEYTRRNENGVNIDSIFNNLDADSIALQYQYIAVNKNPLGKKDALVDAADPSYYSRLHKIYHPHIRDYLDKFGFYDIFLVDSQTGDIVYSVYKELDYTTSLINGPFADSALGQVFKQANTNQQESFVAITDFAPYTPSYEDSAAFIASPIFIKGKKIGILIFQMPIDRINSMMTYGQRWKQSGLGETGETYLVGSDKKMRSMGRFFVEDKAAYFELMEKNGMESGLLKTLSLKNTTIGLQSVNSLGVNNALTGIAGVEVFDDYRNVSVVAAFSPIEIGGLKWGIISKMDETEAFGAVNAMRYKIYKWGSIALAVVVFLSFLVGRYFGKWVLEPIQYSIGCLNAIAGDIERGHCDLVQQLEPGSNAIAVKLTSAINRMTNGYARVLREVRESAIDVSNSAQQMADNTLQSQESIKHQQVEVESVSKAMNMMAESAQDVTQSAVNGAQIAQEANQLSSAGADEVAKTIREIEQLANNVEQAAVVVHELEDDSKNIGSVLDVIQGIAEQTNLLALNAAIEAARAGEQGRGFAVVADEVRTLASRTQDSTQQIQSIIDQLQSRSKKAVKTMEASCSQAKHGVGQVQVTGDALTNIANKVVEIDEMASKIAKSAEQQDIVAEEINRNIRRISEISDQNFNTAELTSITGNALSEQAASLQSKMNNFKL